MQLLRTKKFPAKDFLQIGKRGLRSYHFLALFFCSSFSYRQLAIAQEPEDLQKEVASSKQWRALLYFERGQSVVPAGSRFFLSSNGNTNPYQELQATLKAFAQDPAEVPCRYPARALYLQKIFKFPLDLTACMRFSKWKAAIRAKSLELLFASAYLGSPSSMYGHLMLKFKQEEEGSDLLDYTLNYGADVQGAGGPSYVVKGLTGGFSGFFSTAPYYIKIKEYDFVESRDLWSYRLNFTQEEIDFLVAHAWEIREVSLPYYFLNKNCAYYVFLFLRVVRPEVEIPIVFSYWTIPVDVIRSMQSESWITGVDLRASRKAKLQEMKKTFSAQEKTLVKALARGERKAATSPLVAEASYELFQMDQVEKRGATSVETEQWLLAQKHLLPLNDRVQVSQSTPQAGHPTGRWLAGAGKNEGHAFAEIQIRLALHDFLSRVDGFTPWSTLEMGKFTARFQGHKLFLEESDLLHLDSLDPMDSWFPSNSFTFLLGSRMMRELDCEAWLCQAAVMRAGWGKSLAIGRGVAFARGIFDFRIGAPFQSVTRGAISPQLGLLQNWSPLSFSFTGERVIPVWGDRRAYYALIFEGAFQAAGSWEVRGKAQKFRNTREASLGFAHFF